MVKLLRNQYCNSHGMPWRLQDSSHVSSSNNTAHNCLLDAIKRWDPLCPWYDLSLPPLLLIICEDFLLFAFFSFSRVCHLKLSLRTSWLRISYFWLSSDRERCWHKTLRQRKRNKNGMCVLSLSLTFTLTLALRLPSPMFLIGQSHLTSPDPYKIPPPDSYQLVTLQIVSSLNSSQMNAF